MISELFNKKGKLGRWDFFKKSILISLFVWVLSFSSGYVYAFLLHLICGGQQPGELIGVAAISVPIVFLNIYLNFLNSRKRARDHRGKDKPHWFWYLGVFISFIGIIPTFCLLFLPSKKAGGK